MVRDALLSEFPVIQAIHRAGGLDYQLPDLSSPLIIANKVAVGPQGIIGSCFLRLTAETFLLLDPSLGPREKFATIAELQPEIVLAAWRLGLDDLNARIPETTERRFHKRLTQLGWEKARPGWSEWSRCVQP